MAVQQQFKVNGVQYRLQTRRCGKQGCKCAQGREHGPYWYAYRDHGPAQYVGSALPAHITKHRELLKTNGPKLKKLKTEINKRLEDARAAVRKAETELRTVQNLEMGEYTASEVLKSLGLEQFNGQGGE